jgi:hypothetical protein
MHPQRDLKDVIGTLMRVLDGGEVTEDELKDVGFEAEGDLETLLNEAWVKLREFARDRELRANDPQLDSGQRVGLQDSLDRIVKACSR